MAFAALAALMGVVVLAADEADIAAFRKARFGMFIHWGLYAQLGGRWKGEKMDYIGEWIQSRYQIPNAEYAKLAKDFNPVKFDADEWARQAKDAGMEYVVFTTKHHEGFSMYATKVSDYNIVDATPFKRDVFGELAAACRRNGLKVGIYYSQALDWHEFDAADPTGIENGRRTSHANHGMDWGNTWDFADPTKKEFGRYLEAKVYPQLKELLTNYGDIFVIWFDCPMCMTREQVAELKRYVRSFQPHVLVNSRIGFDLGDFGSLGDNQMLAGASDFPLESPITLNDTWGFKFDDHNWKSADAVAQALMQDISCNANLLLNVGPRPDGRFPDASSDILSDLAAWRRNTGVVIKGSGKSPFPQAMPWGCCTTAGANVLQLVVRSDWTDDLRVAGIRNRVRRCSLPYEKTGDILRIALPKTPTLMPRVIRVETEGAADVDPRLMPQNGELLLLPTAGKVSGDKCRISDHGSFTDWHHSGDTISWTACFPEPGTYEIAVRTETWWHGRTWAGDRTVEVSVGNRHFETELRKDRVVPSTVYERADTVVGTVAIPAVGEYAISVETLAAGPEAVYQDLTQVRIVGSNSKKENKK